MPVRSRSIVVLGAGITGLTAAWKLSTHFHDRVVLLEKEGAVGGLAATFRNNGFAFDVGSHRLHEGYDPEVDRLVKDLCGPDLLTRRRRGLIYLQDRPLRYPPTAFDILLAFGPGDGCRFLLDFLAARLQRLTRPREPDNFEDFTMLAVGKSLYHRFYEPYAVKLYGMKPRHIAKDPAMHRVRKFAFSTIYRDLKKRLLRQEGTYLYPAQGIGQLAQTLERRFRNNGGRLLFVPAVQELVSDDDRTIKAVSYRTAAGAVERLEADLVVSTIPLDALHSLLHLRSDGAASPPFDLRWRGLRLLYLVTQDKVPGDHETFYFPEGHIPFGRVSELGKYSPALNQPGGRSVLTVEFPCSVNDDTWNMPDAPLAELCVQELQRLGLVRRPLRGDLEFFSRKFGHVYPVYDLNWRERFDRIYGRLNSLGNLYMVGRTALFLHCNIDHCMVMALRLAKYLTDGHEDKRGWEPVCREFFDYRVHE
jgi:protoporphyrinogen oxidase